VYLTALQLVLALTVAEANNEAGKTLARVNYQRKKAGLEPVTLDRKLSRACLAHAKYLAKHCDPLSMSGINPHDEDPKKGGYTQQGIAAARMSVIFFFAGPHKPAESIDDHLATLFHRISLIHPDLKKIGFGHVFFKGDRCWVVVDTKSARQDAGQFRQPVLYPAAGQKNVPRAYFKNEFPNPIPAQGRGKQAGYPITASFPPRAKVTEATAVLKDSRGQKVAAWISSPEQPALRPEQQQNTICLIPKTRLRARTTYSVTIKAKVDGKDWSRTWKFTTRKK
jgi:hypothetical protein